MNFKRAILTLIVLMVLPGLAMAQFTARFDVNLIWVDSDFNPITNGSKVTAVIKCNTGLPLTQSFKISATEGVIFVVTELIDIGALGCRIFPKWDYYTSPGYKDWSVSNAGELTPGGCLFVGGNGGNAFELNECDLFKQRK